MNVSGRPRVGVSSCLLGEAVRWDGGHKRDAGLVERVGRDVDWVPVCPEVEMGLGTPREPINLVWINGETRLTTANTGRDLTDIMRRYARARVAALAREHLSGYVLKADSLGHASELDLAHEDSILGDDLDHSSRDAETHVLFWP